MTMLNFVLCYRDQVVILFFFFLMEEGGDWDIVRPFRGSNYLLCKWWLLLFSNGSVMVKSCSIHEVQVPTREKKQLCFIFSLNNVIKDERCSSHLRTTVQSPQAKFISGSPGSVSSESLHYLNGHPHTASPSGREINELLQHPATLFQ